MTREERQTKKESIKRNKEEEKRFRKLQKAISSLPKPSFNNPEKVQPTKAVNVPLVIPASLSPNTSLVSPDEKPQRVLDSPVILDTNSTRIERVAHIRKPKKAPTIWRILSYLKQYWYMLFFVILFCILNSIFEVFIPLLVGDAIDYIVGSNDVNFEVILQYILYLSIAILGFCRLQMADNTRGKWAFLSRGTKNARPNFSQAQQSSTQNFGQFQPRRPAKPYGKRCRPDNRWLRFGLDHLF